jgi:hypothetical protein
VRADDTVETLAARVFEEEKIALPEALRRHISAEGGPPGRGAPGSASSRAS